MKCYGFFLDKELKCSDIVEVVLKENIVQLGKDPITIIAYKPEKQIWFYSENQEILNAFWLGLNFAITNLSNFGSLFNG